MRNCIQLAQKPPEIIKPVYADPLYANNIDGLGDVNNIQNETGVTGLSRPPFVSLIFYDKWKGEEMLYRGNATRYTTRGEISSPNMGQN